MNIDDVKNVEAVPEDTLRAIFDRQHELMVKYGPIEQRNGFYYPEPGLDINDAQFQTWIKNFFWRATEEISEAFEVEPYLGILEQWKKHWDTDVSIRHFFEELADALHFIVEVSIMTGLTVKMVKSVPNNSYGEPQPQYARRKAFDIIFKMGLAANTLKNKPWKSTQMLTDLDKFKSRMLDVWASVNDMWYHLNVQPAEVFQLYHKKAVVNAFRQDTKY